MLVSVLGSGGGGGGWGCMYNMGRCQSEGRQCVDDDSESEGFRCCPAGFMGENCETEDTGLYYGSDMGVLTVIRVHFLALRKLRDIFLIFARTLIVGTLGSRVEALPGGISRPSFSLGPNGRGIIMFCRLQVWCIHHYKNFSMQYTEIFSEENIAGKFHRSDFLNNFAQNIHRGYTLEPPHRGGSNEYSQCMF